MMTVFWISAFLLFHAYFGYPISAWMWVKWRSGRPAGSNDQNAALPRIAFIIPAYNEAGVIREKCLNTLALDYPASLLDIVVVSDGSTDNTPDITADINGVRVLHSPERRGKAAVLNQAVVTCGDAQILVFSDANTFLNRDALKLMMRHYVDPAIGGVSGEKRVVSPSGHPVHGEGMYWRYESIMKRLDAEVYSMVAATGESFSMRMECWEPIPEDTILDDLHLTLTVCRQGYRFAYEPRAIATEPPSPSLADEWERKMRIAAGAFQALFRFRWLWLPFGHVRLWYIYLSRRILRWIFAPVCLALLLLSNMYMLACAETDLPVYRLAMAGQCCVYTMAAIGWGLNLLRRPSPPVIQACFYVVFMHAAMFAGFIRYVSGKQSAIWIKASRR